LNPSGGKKDFTLAGCVIASRMVKPSRCILLALAMLAVQCGPRLPDMFVPVGAAAKVSGGDRFSPRTREAPFTDSPDLVDLWATVYLSKDTPALESLIRSGRVVFVPYETPVDVIEHNQREAATKVKIRGGVYIGREVWMHPSYVTPQ
jgi:hypothetical protein